MPSTSSADGGHHPIGIAVVGAGPAGFYVTGQLLRDAPVPVHVDIFDRLPTPWGLVRSGVAPDHPKIKSVSRVFERTASDSRFRFFGNVEFGSDIDRSDLLGHYDAIVYATGAQTHRQLDVPGEDLPGCCSSVGLVGWYNGHPDHVDTVPDLSCERAVVIGNGNVSLDVARILCRDVSELSQTDIADHALEVLAQSAVRELVVCGRRGPAEAAFTAAELKELIRLSGVTVCAQTDASDAPTGESTMGPNSELLHGLTSTATPAAPRTIEFRFLRSPVAIRGAGHVEEVELAVNELVSGEHGMRVRDTGQRERISCGLVVTSIGYRGVGLAGVPFDAQTGRIPNEAGRVLTADGHASGEYCAGWIKRGPSGVIGTNKQCATETVSSLLTDLATGSLAPRTDDDEDSITAVLSTRGVTVVDQPAWLRVDAHEKAQGQRSARPRVKLCRRSQLLDRAHDERGPAPAVTV